MSKISVFADKTRNG